MNNRFENGRKSTAELPVYNKYDWVKGDFYHGGYEIKYLTTVLPDL
jgi:hypothetical protein